MKFLKEKLLLSEKGYSDLKSHRRLHPDQYCTSTSCRRNNFAVLAITKSLLWEETFLGEYVGITDCRHHSFTSGLPCSKK
ncbi:MAG: hypothetical protein ACLVD8_26685 [Enterocloster sp.]|uniref:hypothetical protein n=1 Tax=Enterocloster sp. TaxID=2719315 RepID=UPI0039996AC1